MSEATRLQKHNLLNFGLFRLDPRNEQLWRGQEVIRLTNKALAVLRYLIEHSRQLVTKDELFAAVWPGVVVSDSALVVCIRELRQALGDGRRTPQFIETVHGRGYRFIAPITSDTAPVSSSEFQVPSREEVASSQHQVASNNEEGQKLVLGFVEGANGETGLASHVQNLEANGQGLAASIQRLESENQPSLPLPIQRPNGQPLLLAPSARHFWSRRNGMLFGLLLLVGGSIAVHYLALSRPSPQSLPLPDKPSIVILPFTHIPPAEPGVCL